MSTFVFIYLISFLIAFFLSTKIIQKRIIEIIKEEKEKNNDVSMYELFVKIEENTEDPKLVVINYALTIIPVVNTFYAAILIVAYIQEYQENFNNFLKKIGKEIMKKIAETTIKGEKNDQ